MASIPEAPLGVFDSGLGGLTVVQALGRALPDERIVYLGDTARVPYGTRSAATVARYARACARVLTERGVKALVVACNTVSAVALDLLRAELDVPVLGVVEPGARAAVSIAERVEEQQRRPVRIGVLGTASTVGSGAYSRAVARLSTRHEVVAQAAPLLVPLVEEGWIDGEVPRLAVERYLLPLLTAGAGVVVLGCTHYPVLKAVIARGARSLSGVEVPVVDSAEATAVAVRDLLVARGMVAPGGAPRSSRLELLVTDMPASFSAVARRFLGDDAPDAQQIDL